MNRDLCYRGLGYAAWGYLFLHININLGNMDLLPEWAGYLLLLSAIGLLKAERRDLALLSPLGGLLALAAGADWLAVIFTGQAVTGRFLLLSALVTCLSLYFRFQLLTDMGRLAEDWSLSAGTLLGCRNADAVLQVILFLPLPWADWEIAAVLLALVGLTVCIVIMVQLFALRRAFSPEEDEEVSP